ncbi:uncharacterized protein [Ptychodera flava]|uniref:uncharacterized protein n=1 Tax=Ptychodera flava TaxID=63121 RepID=UPI00396A66CA
MKSSYLILLLFLVSRETFGQSHCDFTVIGSQAVGENDILVPVNYDVAVVQGVNLILDSGVYVAEEKDICVTRHRAGDTTVVGCTNGVPSHIDYIVSQHSLEEYKGTWSLNIYNLQSYHNESKYVWTYRDTEDIIGETNIRLIESNSAELWVNAASGRNMSVVLKLDEDLQDAKDIAYETADKILFSYENRQGFAQDCYVYHKASRIFPIHRHNFLAINKIDVAKCTSEGKHVLTVTPNAFRNPERTSVFIEVEGEVHVDSTVVHKPEFQRDTAVLQCTANSKIFTSTWFINDIKIQNDERHRVVNGITKSTLTVKDVNDDDVDYYHCQVKTCDGEGYSQKISLKTTDDATIENVFYCSVNYILMALFALSLFLNIVFVAATACKVCKLREKTKLIYTTLNSSSNGINEKIGTKALEV